MNPQEFLNVLKSLKNYKQTVLYYGPSSLKEVDLLVSKTIQSPKKFAEVPATKRYTEQTTPKNEVIIAPYDAKNIYMVQLHNPRTSSGLPTVLLSSHSSMSTSEEV